MINNPKPWAIPETEITPEDHYVNRRVFLREMGLLGVSAAAVAGSLVLPAKAKAEVAMPDPNITPESIVSRYNNFYEFSPAKDRIWQMAKGLRTDDWRIRVEGLVKKPVTLDAHQLIGEMPLEERVYRLRCVEAWSVTVPWTGFPLSALIKKLEPLSSARYVKFFTFVEPNIALGQKHRFWEPWPYTEGLTLAEATHELSFMATGIYGHSLPPQNGAPIRLVVPWKYGFKSIKSIVKIEFTREEPETFWQTVSPTEYDFWANVEPHRPYARWQQEFERVPGRDERVKTKPFNGYAQEVAHLYA